MAPTDESHRGPRWRPCSRRAAVIEMQAHMLYGPGYPTPGDPRAMTPAR
jgi:hypothetical protein